MNINTQLKFELVLPISISISVTKTQPNIPLTDHLTWFVYIGATHVAYFGQKSLSRSTTVLNLKFSD